MQVSPFKKTAASTRLAIQKRIEAAAQQKRASQSEQTGLKEAHADFHTEKSNWQEKIHQKDAYITEIRKEYNLLHSRAEEMNNKLLEKLQIFKMYQVKIQDLKIENAELDKLANDLGDELEELHKEQAINVADLAERQKIHLEREAAAIKEALQSSKDDYSPLKPIPTIPITPMVDRSVRNQLGISEADHQQENSENHQCWDQIVEARKVIGADYLKGVTFNQDEDTLKITNEEGDEQEFDKATMMVDSDTIASIAQIKCNTEIETVDIVADFRTIEFAIELINRVAEQKGFESIAGLVETFPEPFTTDTFKTIEGEVGQIVDLKTNVQLTFDGATSPTAKGNHKADELEGEGSVLNEFEEALLRSESNKGAAEDPIKSSSVKSTADSYEEYNGKTPKEKVTVLLDTIIKPRLEELYRTDHPEKISEYEFSVLNKLFEIIKGKELDTLGGFIEILNDLKILLVIRSGCLAINGTKTNVTGENYTFSSAFKALNKYKSELTFQPYSKEESFKYAQHKGK